MIDERPNWVDERARCTLESKFEELVATARDDVKEANKAVSSVRHGQLFVVEKIADRKVKIRRYPEQRPRDTSGYVTFELDRKKIVIHLPGERFIEIVPRWNETEVQCDLIVEGEPLPLWRISQKALGDFFFEEEDS